MVIFYPYFSFPPFLITEIVLHFIVSTSQLAVEESKNFKEKSMTLVMVPKEVVTVQKPAESPKKNDAIANEVSTPV